MTTKQKILRMVERLDDDVSYDQVLYHLTVMRNVEVGLAQANQGEVIDHDALMAEMDAEDAQDQTRLVAQSKRRPAKHKTVHREGRAGQGHQLHKTPQARARKTKKVS
jgi:hypothetical protein